MIYDLEERTTYFSKNLIFACRGIDVNTFNKNIISQLLRSGTSIGANYREANGCISKKDFKNKIHICKKEAKETMYWLDLLIETESKDLTQLYTIKKEAHELTLIFSKIAFSTN